jgi:hypothetical protein
VLPAHRLGGEPPHGRQHELEDFLTDAINRTAATPARNSPLIDYALKGLDQCWLPDQGRWSHIYHLDGRASPNQSLPHSDVFYTLNVLLGMSRVQAVPAKLNLQEIFRHNIAQLTRLPVAKYAFGMGLWSSAELRADIPGQVLDAVREILRDKNGWFKFRAQDLGMLLIGVVAQAKLDAAQWSKPAAELAAFLVDHFLCSSGLFRDAPRGSRRRFATFATNTYLTLACYHYGEFAGNSRFTNIAVNATRKLIELQGANGEWPWFFDAVGGRVVDFYEVYSVHQYGMAPAFLECAERHDVKEARDALAKGFRWVFGSNQLGIPMLRPELHLSIRSQVRDGELHTNKKRAIRATINALLGRSSTLIDPKQLVLRLECRSYELGWILWSFGQRADFPELTDHAQFRTSAPVN